jgi:NADP-dependent 3-hydroxy acid dehydrogenase YdfG/acyl carrier protein
VAGAALGEPEFAVRGGELRVPRLARAASPAGTSALPAAGTSALPAAGTVLITGASGALGGLVARHLAAAAGPRHLLLASRRGAAGMNGLAAELTGLGASVRVVACDVADRAALAAVIAAIPPEAPLRGVVHAAGILDDATVASLTSARTDAVMAAKADGAWHLHELTAGLDLDMFVLFSSLAGITGSAGQGNYAAASTFLDALAAHRRDRGLAGMSLAWGAWEQSAGMAGQLALAGRQRLARAGLGTLTDAEGLALFDAAVATREALLVPARLDATGRGSALSPLMSGLAPDPGSAGRRSGIPVVGVAGGDPQASRDGSAGGPGAGGLAARLAGLPEAERDGAVLDAVLAQVALALGMTGPGAVDASRPFRDLGFDSLTAVELRNQLAELSGLRLPATLVFSYPTPADLADYLRSRIACPQAAPPSALPELDKLESALAEMATDSADRAKIAARLEAIARSFRAVTAEAAPAGLKLDEATDDEMFDLIDAELGFSRSQ